MRICCAHIFGACLGKAHFKSARNTLPKNYLRQTSSWHWSMPGAWETPALGQGFWEPSGRPSSTSSPSYEIRSKCHGSWLERADHHLLLRFQAVVLSWTRGHNQICSKMEATSRKKTSKPARYSPKPKKVKLNRSKSWVMTSCQTKKT